MGKLIVFHIPEGFKAEPKRERQLEAPRVIEFNSKKPDEFRQNTWIFSEFDADLG